jgi:hypothetical protein
MAFIGYRNDGSDERRLGRRVSADIPIAWSTPKSAGFGLRRALKGAVGTIVDVSLSGAAVTGPSRLPFEVGATVLFQYEGHDCSAIVRRRRPTGDPSIELFGLELVVVHPLLKRRIQQLVAEARTEARSEAPWP